MNAFTKMGAEVLRKRRKKEPSTAANVGLGAVFGGALGAPAGGAAGSMLAAHLVGKRAHPPKGLSRWQRMRWYQTKAPGIGELTRQVSRGAVKGSLVGGVSGLTLGALLGHQIARALKKEGAAIASRLTPQSSNVRGYSYDPKTQDLVVTFKNGGTYRYAKVPPAIAKALGRNKSVGKTLNKRVKGGGYAYEKTGADLTARGRNQIKEKNFALPGERYPIQDRAHARNALARVAQHGSPEEQARVRAKVHAKFPGIGKGQEKEAGLKRKLLLGTGLTAAGLAAGKDGIDREIRKRLDSYEPKLNPILTSTPGHEKKSSPLVRTVGNLQVPRGLAGVTTKAAAKQWYRKASRKFHPDLGGDTEKFQRLQSFWQSYQPEFGKLAAMLRERIRERRAAKKKRKATWGKGMTASQRFVLSRSPGGLKKKASLEQIIANRLVQKRRTIAKLAGAAKKQVTWNGITMKLEYLTGDKRSGINGTTGEKWSRVMKDNYGYVPGTYGKGADGDAIDVYFNEQPVDGPVYKIRQKKRDGGYDEDKFMVGYGSNEAARKAFGRNMPDWAFGSMTGLPMKKFLTLVGQQWTT